jgi:2-pyrone-4,6-dicarboxylate lactonase
MHDVCDCHAHIFGPFVRFPLAEGTGKPPPESPLEAYLAMLDRVGVGRGVLVHGAAHGRSCAALLNAARRCPDRLRGVAIASGDTTAEALADLHAAGVRGLRFIEMPLPPGGPPHPGRVGFDDLRRLAPAMRAAGLHAQLWTDCTRFLADADWICDLGIPVVLDHMGRCDIAAGVDGADFRALLRLLGQGRIWVKLTPCRLSRVPPDYPDVRPFHDALVQENPEQLVWGSDWPHGGMGADKPDNAALLALFREWVREPALQRRILTENAVRLYGFG